MGARPMTRETRREVEWTPDRWAPFTDVVMAEMWRDAGQGRIRTVERYVTEWAPVEETEA